MTRLDFAACAMVSCLAVAPIAVQAVTHGPDVTLDQLETIQNVSLQTEEHAPFTLRAAAPEQFKLSGLPTSLQTLQNDRATPQQNICASIRNKADAADAELTKVLTLALDFDYCVEQPS